MLNYVHIGKLTNVRALFQKYNDTHDAIFSEITNNITTILTFVKCKLRLT
jgi:hypothetical protein